MLVSPCTLFRLFPAPLAGCAPGVEFRSCYETRSCLFFGL